MKNIIFYLVLIGFIFSDNFYNWNILNTKINNTKKITTINPKEKIDIEFEYIINDTTTNTHQLILFFDNQIIDCINVTDFNYNKLYNGSFNSPSKPGNYVVTIYSLNEKDCISTHNLFKSSNNYKEIAFVKVSDNSTLIFTCNNQTANSTISKVGIIVLYENKTGTNTLNTDLIAKISANGGTNYETVTLSALGTFDTGVLMAGAQNVTISNTGTAMKYQIAFANQSLASKECRVHGVALMY